MKLIQVSPKGLGKSIAIIFVLLTFVCVVFAQEKVPLIKANNKVVTIKDGPVIRKNTWTISPEVKLDQYFALKSQTAKKITFYTDIDSISFHCKPGVSYVFGVILQDRDTCYTEIVMEEETKNKQEQRLFGREQLAMDWMVLRDYLEREHAGLYRYRNKEDMDKLFDSKMQSITKSMGKLEFGKQVMQLISELKDGHTGTNLSSMLLNKYRDSTLMFPLLLYFDNQGSYVRCGKLNDFPVGTQILSINGRDIKEIVKELYSYLPGDGHIQSKKRHTLNNGAFGFLYRFIFGESKTFSIEYKNLKGKKMKAEVKASFSTDFDCDLKTTNRNSKDLDLFYAKEDIAVLTIKTFDQDRIGKAGLNFPNFLEDTFAELNKRKIEKLIIDLRNNGGGFNEYGPLLYSYLAKGDFNYFKAVYRANDTIQIKDNPFTKVQSVKSSAFKGKVVFLINGLSFSTTADFSAIAKSYKRGKFVGEETAGAYQGNNSGKTFLLDLPNTGIQVVIPQFRYVNNVRKTKYMDRGVLPDVQVIPELNDVASNKDVQFERALKLLLQD